MLNVKLLYSFSDFAFEQSALCSCSNLQTYLARASGETIKH